MLHQLSFFAFCSIAAAATTSQPTVTVHIPAYSQTGIVGSVVAIEKAVTTYVLNCPTDTTEDDECGMPENFSVTYGPSTLIYTFSTTEDGEDSGFTNILDCSLALKEDFADCTAYVDGSISGETEKTSLTTKIGRFTSDVIDVTITAGADKLDGATTTVEPAGSATKTAAGTTATGADVSETSAASDDTQTAATTPEGTGSSVTGQSTPTNSDNAAGPAATLQIILAGAAAIVGGAAVML